MSEYLEHAKSLALEIESVKDKVRNLADHWPSDGSHKEEVLKRLISNKLPKRYEVASGFIVTPKSRSTQIDLMVIDSDKPVLERSADNNVFVTPDAVKAIIEIKTKLSSKKQYSEVIDKIAKNKKLCHTESIWTGLFVTEFDTEISYWDGPDDHILISCDEASTNDSNSRINCISVGKSLFIRYWENSKMQVNGIVDSPAWHSYFMSDLAPAYFLGNLIDFISEIPDNYSFVWFPIPDGKESLRRWYKAPNIPPEVFPGYLKTLKQNGIKRQLEKIMQYKDHNK